MASPTEAEIKTQLNYVFKMFNEFRKFSGTHTAAGSAINVSDNYLNMEDSLTQNLETNFLGQWGAGIGQLRAAHNVSMQAHQAAAIAGFLEYGKFILATEVDLGNILRRLYTYYQTGTKYVTSRQFSFATPSALTGTGTGTINRLNKDAFNFDIEAQTPDTKYIECVADEHSGGDEHEEQFEIRGTIAEQDGLKVVGSGRIGGLRAKSARDSFQYMSNPSFSQYSGTIAVPTDITDWTVTTALSNFEIDQTNYYRDFIGDATPGALKFKANDTVTQNFNTLNARFNAFTPYYLQIAYNRSVGSGDGTLGLTLGSKSTSVALVAQSGWQILRMPIGQDNWFSRWNAENPTVAISLSARTTGTVLVDDVVLTPYDNFDGSWYAIVGSSVPFLRKDYTSWTDTATEAAIVQYFLWRFYNAYLPHTTGGGVTWAEPS